MASSVQEMDNGEFEPLVCNACQFAITTSHQRSGHYRSEWHRYNVKRRVAGLQPIGVALFDSQLQLLTARKQLATAVKLKSKCSLCSNKTFASDAAYNAHLSTKKHIKAEKQLLQQQQQQNDEDNIDEDDNSSGEASEPIVINHQIRIKTHVVVPPTAAEIAAEEAAAAATAGTTDDDDNDEEPELDLTEAIHAYNGICLFCNTQHDSVETCVTHMLKAHGFFIPFVDYLTNLTNNHDSNEPGLLAYLGAKIGAGKTCIWCNQRFSSVRAVQQHMISKSHCKIRLDDSEDEEEIAPFYTFTNNSNSSDSGDEDESEDTAMTTTEGRVTKSGDSSSSSSSGGGGVSHFNDYDELVLRDGSVLGHRALIRIYDQKYREARSSSNSPQLALITQIRQQYNHVVLPAAAHTAAAHHPYADRIPKNVIRNQQRGRLYTELMANNQTHFRAQMLV